VIRTEHASPCLHGRPLQRLGGFEQAHALVYVRERLPQLGIHQRLLLELRVDCLDRGLQDGLVDHHGCRVSGVHALQFRLQRGAAPLAFRLRHARLLERGHEAPLQIRHQVRAGHLHVDLAEHA